MTKNHTTQREVKQDTHPTFEDVSEALSVIRQSDDGNRWSAGDLAAAWLAQIAEGEKVAELGRLANASGYAYGGLRERVDCSTFWPIRKRHRFKDFAWSYFNRARRGADLPRAIERMQHLKNEPMDIDKFGKWCRGQNGVGTSNTDDPQPPAPAVARPLAGLAGVPLDTELAAIHARLTAIIEDEATPLEKLEYITKADRFLLFALGEAVTA